MSIWKAQLNIEATSQENCRRIKAASPLTRCFIYHNMELALQALESQRLVMYDAAYATFFLQYPDRRRTQERHHLQRAGGAG